MTTGRRTDFSIEPHAPAAGLDADALAKLLSALPGMAYECSVSAPWTMNFVSEGVVGLCEYQSSAFTSGVLVWGDIVHPDDLERIAAEVDAAVAAERQFTLTYRIISKSGDEKWVLERGEALFDPTGHPQSLVGFIGDITEQKTIELRLRDSEEHHRSTLELNAQLSWSTDPQGNVLELGSRFLEVAGVPDAKTLGRDWISFVHPEDKPGTVRKWSNALKNGRTLDVRFRVRLPNGHSRWVRARAAPKRDSTGRIVRWYGTTEDIDDQVAAEVRLSAAEHRHQREMAQASRSTAMGTMASTLAHELNQPLAAAANWISGSLRLLGRGPDFAEEAIEGFSQAAAAVHKAGEIIRRVRKMVATGEASMTPHYLLPIVQESLVLTAEQAREAGVAVELRVQRLCVAVDRIQIQQVLENLIRNAIEAMAASETRQLKITATRIRNLVEVSVSDTGSGVAPRVRAELFTPFHSTKESGLGVGLSLCRTIIEAHGGKIRAEENPAGGTIFRFTVPLAGSD